MKKKLLILCTGNSCRSQMAHGYFKHLAGDKIEVYSAGVKPEGVNANAIKVMKEEGIDISKHISNHIDEYLNLDFDYIITVCDNAKEQCPYFPSNAKKIHQDFPDPAKAIGREEELIKEYRKVRNVLKKFCLDFIKTNLI